MDPLREPIMQVCQSLEMIRVRCWGRQYPRQKKTGRLLGKLEVIC